MDMRNPMKYDMIFYIEVVDAYTNITFTEKQKEDMPKLYDQLKYSGVLDSIIDKIPIAEISMLKDGADATLKDGIETILLEEVPGVIGVEQV